MRSARMPCCNRAGLARMQSRIGEDFTGAADQPRPGTALPAALFLAMRKIVRDDRGVLIRRRCRAVPREKVDAGLVSPLIKRDLQPPRHQPLLHVAPPAAAGANANQIDRAMAD